MPAYKKGARVEFIASDGRLITGTVLRGGSKKVQVVEDKVLDKYWSVPPSRLAVSTTPLPRDPEVTQMDRYEVRKYREIDGHGDSRTFSAEIWRDGHPLLVVMNNGWGGFNDYSAPTPELAKSQRMHVDELRAHAHEWATRFGRRAPLEPEDDWIEWYQHERPYGITAREYNEKFQKALDEMTS